jgi:hypothetical protein
MRQIEAIDIEKEFTVRKSRWQPVEPHVLREFFRSRKVSNKKLAKVLRVSSVMIGHWLNGHIPMPPLRENQLNSLADKIKEYELAHGGVMFNADEPPKRKAIKK